MTQFFAMLVDAYRELNSRMLFWVVLAISTLVMLFYASIGFDQNGMFFFFGLWHVENEFIREGSPIAALLYRAIFTSFIMNIWLAWAAVILALISTTTIFPDFVAAGSIDMMLSKPISRVRLFFTKYILSLLFVILQVTIFCVGVFLCIGWRIGDWDPRIFAAIPLVTLFYSYLFSFNVLVGVWTRSALAALLFTMLLWVSIFSANLSEQLLLQNQLDYQVDVESDMEDRDELAKELAAIEDTPENAVQRAQLESQVKSYQSQIDANQKIVDTLAPWTGLVQWIKYFTPKTGETLGLLERWLSRDDDVSLTDILGGDVEQNRDGEFVATRQSNDAKVMTRLQEIYDSRSISYVLGTSLAFEAVMLGLACFVFVRRDY